MNIATKKLIMFDLDGTLAPSKSPLENDMAQLFIELLAKTKVAVISGGAFPQFEQQFLRKLPSVSERFSHLYLLPTSGTQLFTWKGSWVQEYSELISADDRKRIVTALNTALRAIGYIQPEKIYGELIEDRGSQVTFSALGQTAPLELKIKWDANHAKRDKIVTLLQKSLPEYDSRIGGTTSIDITRKGVNKAYGIRKLETFLKITPEEILFVGDTLFPGGNDYPARATGVDCIQVSGPEETAKLITSALSS